MKSDPVTITIYDSLELVFKAGFGLVLYYIVEALGMPMEIDPVGYLLILFACWFILDRIRILKKRIIKYLKTVFFD